MNILGFTVQHIAQHIAVVLYHTAMSAFCNTLIKLKSVVKSTFSTNTVSQGLQTLLKASEFFTSIISVLCN